MTTQLKRCPRCGPRPLDAFARRTGARDGRQAYCRACARAYQKPWAAGVRAKARALSGKKLRDRAADAAARAAVVLAAVAACWAREGRPPTLSEVAAGAGLKHVSSAMWYLRGLERAGQVELDRPRGPGWNRAVWPVGLRAKIKALAGGSP